MSFKNPYTLSRDIVSFDLYHKIPSELPSLTYGIGYEILDMILHKVEKSWCDDNSFVVLPSAVMKKNFGNNYKIALEELHDNNLIQTKYLSGKNVGKSFSREDGIARSFRLNFGVLEILENSPHTFKSRKFSYEMPKLNKDPFALKKKSNDPKSLKLLECYRSVSILPNWIDVFVNNEYYPANHLHHPNEPMSQMGMFMHCSYFVESIVCKRIDVKTDSICKRAFHAILMMAEKIRSYVRIDGEVPVNIDAVSLHPYLIAHYIKDKTDKKRYLGYLEKDFYKSFEDTQNSRGRIKVLFQKYLSGKKLYDPKAFEIERWFQENFPDVDKMRKSLKKHKTTFQMQLQQLEASIFVDKVFMGFDKWSLPMHDGLMVKEENRDEAIALIKNACIEKLGYEIPLSVK